MENNRYIFDIETDGFDATKIHCVGFYNIDTKESFTLTDYNDIIDTVTNADTLIGHNIILFDIPTLERLLEIKIPAKLIDTLALSWLLCGSFRTKHSLDAWGQYFEAPKVEIGDWENLTIEEYCERVKQDCVINNKLWELLWDLLTSLYNNKEEIMRLIDYLTFKLQCFRDQEENPITLDVPECIRLLEELEITKEEKILSLKDSMPRVPVYKTKKKPKNYVRKDGSLSLSAQSWELLLKEQGHEPNEYLGDEITYRVGFKDPNPNSTAQKKDWLYSLGWKPKTFKYVKDKDKNQERAIPQITLPFNGGVCDSVKNLYGEDSNVELLEGMSVLGHRIGMLKGFLRDVDTNGKIKAQIAGITPTLRARHKTIVNLPSNTRPYGKEIRGLLTAPEGYEFCGCDMTSLEDKMKQHYIQPYDPKYVEAMQKEGFDPHLDISVLGGLITEGDSEWFKIQKKEKEKAELLGKEYEVPDLKRYKFVSNQRKDGKVTNFSTLYGVGVPKLARQMNGDKTKAAKLHKTYWARNWSVKKFASDQKVKTVKGQKWVYVPLSKFWLPLREEKDVFSVINQSSGVFLFDTFVRFVKNRGLIPVMQMHDEILLCVEKGNRKKVNSVLDESINKVNELLDLNVTFSIGKDWGKNYAEAH